MNNPFQNFNTKYTPSLSSLSFVLSKMEIEQTLQVRSPIILTNFKKSALYNWTLAGGLSFVGVAAAFLFFFQNTNNLSVKGGDVAMVNKDTQTKRSIKIGLNPETRGSSIDDALASVANFNDSNSLNNKF